MIVTPKCCTSWFRAVVMFWALLCMKIPNTRSGLSAQYPSVCHSTILGHPSRGIEGVGVRGIHGSLAITDAWGWGRSYGIPGRWFVKEGAIFVHETNKGVKFFLRNQITLFDSFRRQRHSLLSSCKDTWISPYWQLMVAVSEGTHGLWRTWSKKLCSATGAAPKR